MNKRYESRQPRLSRTCIQSCLLRFFILNIYSAHQILMHALNFNAASTRAAAQIHFLGVPFTPRSDLFFHLLFSNYYGANYNLKRLPKRLIRPLKRLDQRVWFLVGCMHSSTAVYLAGKLDLWQECIPAGAQVKATAFQF